MYWDSGFRGSGFRDFGFRGSGLRVCIGVLYSLESRTEAPRRPLQNPLARFLSSTLLPFLV